MAVRPLPFCNGWQLTAPCYTQGDVRFPAPLPWLLMTLAIAGCQKQLTGASTMPASRVPRGDQVTTYAVVQCTSNQAVPAPLVDHVRLGDGSAVLVERMSSPDWVVITNAFVEGRFVVFQFVQETSQPRALWEYRIPLDQGVTGSFRVSSAFTLETLPGGGFRGVPVSSSASCGLQRVGAPGQARTAAAPSGSSSADVPRSWGYDAKTFVAGDTVLLDMEGRSVRAKVVQANGQMYYVQVEGAPDGSGQWIMPGRITGRIR